MPRHFSWKYWIAAVVSAGLLELPFPLAGPMPPWRSIFAWVALIPLLWAVMASGESGAGRLKRRAFLLGYVCGVLWYAGNCYWIYATMHIHGGLSPVASALLLVGFSLVLGAYFGLFTLAVEVVRARIGLGWALAAAPFLWVAQELAGARITSVPWDQLGYSQIDNHLLTLLAPWTGVYGLSFVLVATNAVPVWILLRTGHSRIAPFITGPWVIWVGFGGLVLNRPINRVLPKLQTTATAVLVQPNLPVEGEDSWPGKEWAQNIAQFTTLAEERCKSYIAGIPQTGAPSGEITCPPSPTPPDLVAWPESPAPFVEADPRFQQSMSALAQAVHAPLVVGGIGADYDQQQGWLDYNSAMLFAADGSRIGRYDKIHLVPYGEYIPYRNLFSFAHKLTGRVSDFSRGTSRRVFHIVDQHGTVRVYGVFICYEAVFADEVREFARNGAQVLVNISDDGWYGDTSAPWQHLNMARMRAVENRRWLLRDTNNGVTAVIDPYGRVRQSISRHKVDALPAEFGFRDDITFYTEHGDVFAWLCAILSIGLVVWALQPRAQLRVQVKVRS